MTTATEPTWQITPEKVQMVVQHLIEIANPEERLFCLGFTPGVKCDWSSDLDVLVVTSHEVESPRQESVRLRNSLTDINVPIDIVVVPFSRFEALRGKLGLIYREADRRARSSTRAKV